MLTRLQGETIFWTCLNSGPDPHLRNLAQVLQVEAWRTSVKCYVPKKHVEMFLITILFINNKK